MRKLRTVEADQLCDDMFCNRAPKIVIHHKIEIHRWTYVKYLWLFRYGTKCAIDGVFVSCLCHIRSRGAATVRHNRNRMLLRRQTRAIAIALSLVVVASRRLPIQRTPRFGGGDNRPHARRRASRLSRTEPRSFNRHAARDSTHEPRLHLTQATLVRIDRSRQAVEPWLAESWTDRRRRPRVHDEAAQGGLVFSDGQPFTADDVVFSFQAVYDERTGSALAGHRSLAGHKKLQVAARRSADGDDHLPGAVCAGPPHPREPAHPAAPSARRPRSTPARSRRRGVSTRRRRSSSASARSCCRQYVPGQRLVFERNAALLRPRRRRHGAARISIASSSRSSRTRARSCCAWSRDSST